MAIQYIQPGKPNQNAYIERFNRTYREELLDEHLFLSLDDVREAKYWWMIEYKNAETPGRARRSATDRSASTIPWKLWF
jgi:putative transposase